MDGIQVQWADLVQNGSSGQIMFVSSPALGDEHSWEGVRNGAYCIWHECGEERWEIYDPQHLRVIQRPKITDPTDPLQAYEVATQKAIQSLRVLTMASFDQPQEVQSEKYLLAVVVFETWIAAVGDHAALEDRSYLEMIVDQNPFAHSEDLTTAE